MCPTNVLMRNCGPLGNEVGVVDILSILRDSAWTGFGALVSTIALMVYIVAERDKFVEPVHKVKLIFYNILWIAIGSIIALSPFIIIVVVAVTVQLPEKEIWRFLASFGMFIGSEAVAVVLYAVSLNWIAQPLKVRENLQYFPVLLHVVAYLVVAILEPK